MNTDPVYKYAILISYIGKDFCGWQKQKTDGTSGDFPSIQLVIEQALSKMTGEEVRIVGSGRTDSGVHALGQVAHFVLHRKKWDERILARGLNGLLPMSIRILGARIVALDFHSQRSAIRKQYSYYFQQGPCPLPHLEPYSWWIRKKLDLSAMEAALGLLKGKHDFKPFQASGARVGATVREILETEVSFQSVAFPQGLAPDGDSPLGLVRVRVIGTGFLKQMVRGIAGTLLQIGENRRGFIDMSRILETGDRSLVGPTAPARALWLERVWYPTEFGLWGDS